MYIPKCLKNWAVYAMDSKKVLSFLGLATRAGKLLSGEFVVEKTIKAGAAKLVIISADASDNTKKKFGNMCTYRKIPIFYEFDRFELGKATGKEYRVSVVITDEGFAEAISSLLKMEV